MSALPARVGHPRAARIVVAGARRPRCGTAQVHRAGARPPTATAVSLPARFSSAERSMREPAVLQDVARTGCPEPRRRPSCSLLTSKKSTLRPGEVQPARHRRARHRPRRPPSACRWAAPRWCRVPRCVRRARLPRPARQSAPAFVSAGAVAPAGAATFTAPPARILLTEPAAPVSSGVWMRQVAAAVGVGVSGRIPGAARLVDRERAGLVGRDAFAGVQLPRSPKPSTSRSISWMVSGRVPGP